MILKNLFLSPDAFKFGVTQDGRILRDREAEVADGTLLVTGTARKKVALRISQVNGNHLVDLHALCKELQIQLLELVKRAIERARLAAVFYYEAAWKRATLRSELRAEHRVETLPRELARRHQRAGGHAMYQLGARAALA
jgi:ribosomal protein L14E/L6E/L27E